MVWAILEYLFTSKKDFNEMLKETGGKRSQEFKKV